MKMNLFCLVGRLVEIKKIDNKKSTIVLRVREEEKTFIFNVTIGTPLFSQIHKVVKQDALMGIHGVLSNNEEGSVELIADKITFMAAKKENEND